MWSSHFCLGPTLVGGSGKPFLITVYQEDCSALLSCLSSFLGVCPWPKIATSIGAAVQARACCRGPRLKSQPSSNLHRGFDSVVEGHSLIPETPQCELTVWLACAHLQPHPAHTCFHLLLFLSFPAAQHSHCGVPDVFWPVPLGPPHPGHPGLQSPLPLHREAHVQAARL